MTGGGRLAELLPHAGEMVLLDELAAWDAAGLSARSRAHLRPGNPLRRGGRLAAVCGIEFGLQAAALHGAMRGGGAQRPGYVARVRGALLHVDWLDDPGFGTLRVEAVLEHAEAGGMVYGLQVRDEAGRVLVEARASVALPE